MMENNIFLKNYKKCFLYKLIILIIIIISLIGVCSSHSNANVFGTLYFCINNPYCLFPLMIIFIINTIFLNKNFFTSYPVIIRNNNFNFFFDDSIKKIIKTNNNIFFTYLMFSLLISIIKNFGNLVIEFYELYHIPLFIYDIFAIIRVLCILHIITIIAYFLVRLSKKYIWAFIYILLIAYYLFFSVYDLNEISSISEIKLSFKYYLLGFNCSSFILEISLSAVYILALYNILGILNVFIKRRIKNDVM